MGTFPFKFETDEKARHRSENEFILKQVDRIRKEGFGELTVCIRNGVVKRVVRQETIE